MAASKKPEYHALIDSAVAYAKKKGGDIDAQVNAAMDILLVEFGKKILEIIPGKVSTEVDARYSFDKEESIKKALHIIDVRSFFSSLLIRRQLLTNNPYSFTRSKESPRTAS